MADKNQKEDSAFEAEKKKIQDEKKQLKKEQAAQKKEAKKRAKEIAKRESDLEDDREDGGGGFVTFLATLFIVILWLAVVCVIIKLDVGGFGTNVMTPLLKDIPVLNKILPGNALTETSNPEKYGGYTNLADAVEQIRKLELELDQAHVTLQNKEEDLNALKAEVIRLQEFEKMQVEFQRIRSEFYDEVVYADKGPGPEEFRKYFESMDPATAESIYKQVVTKLEATKEVEEYARAYSEMKPKQAAGIFEDMTDNLELVAKILDAMSPQNRGAILGVMDPDVAARVTKIMDPES